MSASRFVSALKFETASGLTTVYVSMFEFGFAFVCCCESASGFASTFVSMTVSGLLTVTATKLTTVIDSGSMLD